MQTPAAHKGFTLLEFLFSLALLGLLVGFALPGLGSWLERSRMDAAFRDIQSGLRLARAQAVAMREDVTLCPINSNGECTEFSDRAVIVFADRDGDGRLSGAELPLAEFPLNGVRLYLRVSAGRPLVRYKYSGEAKEWGTLTLCNREGDPPSTRQLVLNLGGRARPAVDTDGDGLVEDSAGHPVYCPDT